MGEQPLADLFEEPEKKPKKVRKYRILLLNNSEESFDIECSFMMKDENHFLFYSADDGNVIEKAILATEIQEITLIR